MNIIGFYVTTVCFPHLQYCIVGYNEGGPTIHTKGGKVSTRALRTTRAQHRYFAGGPCSSLLLLRTFEYVHQNCNSPGICCRGRLATVIHVVRF